ncbi:MAG: molybdopterin molybdenumtransferase MoeA, partial [Bacteroidota bacterium]|nr:molybdopterin molybdenumtransferase MoeA [Bacteroidota bacterium]
VSAFVNFNVFIKPAVNNLYGMEPFDVIKAELVNDVFKSDGKMHFLRGYYSFNESKNSYMVETAVSQSSGNIMVLNNANCLVVIDEEKRNVAKGDWVKCIKI